MKRFVAAVCVAFAGVAATARADTFAIVPAPTPAAVAPNAVGSVAFPLDLLTPPAQPAQLDGAQLTAIWKRAGEAYGVPWEVLAAINKIESNFGRNMGPSSAGAIGWMQFMPSTWERWGTDGNGDGVADPWNPDDAIVSAARYLAAAGGAADLQRAVFAYNHAQWYVNEVFALARTFSSGSGMTFRLDGLAQDLTAARDAVVAASADLVEARQEAWAQRALVRRWLARAASERLLSDQLEARRQATLAGVDAGRADARVAALAHRLALAQAALDRARASTATVSFDRGAGALLGAPSYDGSYVFPVGGGAGVVSVSHHHHDYPAADIAAPEGSPVYALADATVLNAWTTPDPRCGIGLTLRAFDGREWTYCHLATLDPRVVAGASLQAGDPVGLVGHTGDATGPHLHLQLDPASEYPQSEDWFQRFAGTAFSWQDAAPAAESDATATGPAAAAGASAASAPVFAIVATPQPVGGDVVGFTPGP